LRFEALRPSKRPRVREHNSKCTKAKGEGPHDSLRETRARHALAADASGRAAVPRGPCPPRRERRPDAIPHLCGAIKQQAIKQDLALLWGYRDMGGHQEKR
jgi:hypothetical protein